MRATGEVAATGGCTTATTRTSEPPPPPVCPPPESADVVRRRGNRLARALLRLGIQAGDGVAILCCPEHAADAVVAARAAAVIGARVSFSADDCGVPPVRVVLACEEGLTGWRARPSAVVVADAPGALWWKALELREADADLDVGGGAERSVTCTSS